MTPDYAHGVIHTMLATGVVIAILTAILASAGLMTLAANAVIGSLLLLEWCGAYVVWFLWG